jgi:hypothetical protein
MLNDSYPNSPFSRNQNFNLFFDLSFTGGLSRGSKAQNADGQFGNREIFIARLRQVSGRALHEQEDGQGIRLVPG